MLDKRVKGAPGPIQLSLDARVQFILHEELTRVISDFSAKGAAGIIMDVRTGEIVAMVSLPDFDPNHPGATDPSRSPADAQHRVFNKLTLGAYEPGSVFQTLTTAIPLDSGVATMTKHRAVHDIKIGRFTITDYHGKNRALSVPEIYMYCPTSPRPAWSKRAPSGSAAFRKACSLKPVPIEFDGSCKPHYPRNGAR